MSRDPTVPVNLTTTTPVGPVERTLAATQATDRVERLRYWRHGGSAGFPLTAPTVNNISGDLNNATNWYAQDSGQLTVTRLTQAQFLSEQPDATIPYGHINANGILKISNVTATTSGWRLRARNFSGITFANKKNLVLRGYMPRSQATRWDAAPAENLTIWYMSGAVGTYTDSYRSKGLTYTPAGSTIGIDQGHWQYYCAPNAWSSTNALLHQYSNLFATPATGKTGSPTTLDWLEINIRGDGTASPTLDMYIFDIVEFVEEKPTLYLTFDDANDEHLQVCQHLRAGTKFGGGSLGAALPCSFAIPDVLVGGAGRVTLANLRTMVGLGASLMVHGDGPSPPNASTWSAHTTAQMAGEITAFQSRATTEGWPAAYGKAIAYIGNDFYRATTDASAGVIIKDVAGTNGVTFCRGHPFFGAAYPLYAVADTLKGPSTCLIGQGSAAINTAAQAETLMNFMDICRMSVVINGHGVVPSAPGAIDLLESEFDDVFGAIGAEVALGAASRIRVADLIADATALGYV